MAITVRYFASLREALGATESVELPAHLPRTVASLREHLIASDAAHAAALARGRAVRCALNQDMADEDAPVADGDEVAFFPPVTGG